MEKSMLNINFTNLGNIKDGTIDIKPFTIFCGDNNTGKTYATYAIYTLLDKEFDFDFKEIKDIVKKLYQDGLYELDILKFANENLKTLKKEIEKGFKKNLHFVFSAEEEDFKKTSFSFEIDEETIKNNIKESDFNAISSIGKKEVVVFEASKDKDNDIIKLVLHDNKMSKNFLSDRLKNIISKVIFKQLFSNSFLLPAERTGLNLFYKELGRERTTILHHLQKKDIDPMELVKDLFVSRYPQPIGDYIDFLNDIHNLKKIKSEYKNYAYLIQKNILHGKYKIEKDGIYFIPYKSNANKNNFSEKISLHMSSSTVKTFFSLVFYLEHLAKKGDTLIIDEPELNLHPDNQRKIARILSMLTNKNINVLVSTHSDYFMKELNNLIILNNDIKNKDNLFKKYEYTNDMTLAVKDIDAYLFEDYTIKKLNKSKDEGIEVTTFDKVINKLNESTEDIYFSNMD
jgi:predicted ATPase